MWYYSKEISLRDGRRTNMKKTISIALALLMIVSLFACMQVSAFAADESEIAQVKENGKLA